MKSVRIFEGKILLEGSHPGVFVLPEREVVEALPTSGEVFTLAEGACEVASISELDDIPAGLALTDLRSASVLMDEQEYAWAVKGAELLNWDRASRHCGWCGAEMERATEISKRCTGCGRELFPHISPCVMVLVKRGDEALLVRAATFRRPFYGLVAGFVETGETLEECAVREVREETSLEIRNLRYWGSGPWPYPGQLMIGFVADYAGGEVRCADGELTEAAFFRREEAPEIPTPPSLAHRMIEAWLRGNV